MNTIAIRAALSVLSGRVDVCDLSAEQRSALGIDFDPKNSIALNAKALMAVEQCVFEALQSVNRRPFP